MKIVAIAALFIALLQVGLCLKKKEKCSVEPNAATIDWERLVGTGTWYQILNSNNARDTESSCILIKVQEKTPKVSGVSFDLSEIEQAGHTITVYNGELPQKTVKKSSLHSAILSTMKVDEHKAAKLKLDFQIFDVPPENFITDYETYIIGQMCWNDQLYVWAYSKNKVPDDNEYVDLYTKITSVAGQISITFSECNEVQDFSIQ